MMEQAINKLHNWKAAVDTKIYSTFYIFLCLILFVSNQAYSQHSCNDYDEILDGMVNRLFTASRHQDYRQTEFPPVLHQVSPSEIRRLNFPDEQWVCNAALGAIRGDEPVPERERAMYKVKDHYFMVAYTYYTDVQGNQLIEEPSAGVLFDSEFNMISLVLM
jgi:hypothetical protein